MKVIILLFTVLLFFVVGGLYINDKYNLELPIFSLVDNFSCNQNLSSIKWQKFINTKYNYSIEYPSNYTLSNTWEPVKSAVDFSNASFISFLPPCWNKNGGIEIAPGIDRSPNQTLSEYLDMLSKTPFDSVELKDSLKLNSSDAISVEGKFSNYSQKETYIVNGLKAIGIGFFGSRAKSMINKPLSQFNNIKIYEHMAQSFHYLSPTIIDTSCNTDADCVIGIRSGYCDSVANSVSKNVIGQDGYVVFQEGGYYGPDDKTLCSKVSNSSTTYLSITPVCINNKCQNK
jgi:hypothetical protein